MLTLRRLCNRVRYLNLAHVCGYAGLTPVYDHDNLLMHFITEHRLLNGDPVEKDLVEECSSKTGAKTYLRFINFALQVLGRAVENENISEVRQPRPSRTFVSTSPQKHVLSPVPQLMAIECTDRILDMREGLASMYQYHSQVRRQACWVRETCPDSLAAVREAICRARPRDVQWPHRCHRKCCMHRCYRTCTSIWSPS